MKLFRRIGVMVASYLAACLVSSLLVLIYLYLFLPADEFRETEITVLGLVVIAVSLTIVFSCLPAGTAIIYFETTGNSGWAVYALVGALSGFFALAFPVLASGMTFDAWFYALFHTALIMAAGAVGGIVYWKLAVEGGLPSSDGV